MTKQICPSPPWSEWFDFAIAASSRKDWHEAVKRWRVFSAEYPDSFPAKAAFQYALAQQHTGDLVAAEDTLNTALRRFPKNRRLLVAHTVLLMHRHKWSDALERWKHIRGLGTPLSDLDFVHLLTTCRQTGDWTLFDASLLQAKRFFPHSRRVTFQQALRLMDLQKYHEAQNTLEHLAASEPDPKHRQLLDYHRWLSRLGARRSDLPPEDEIMSYWAAPAQEPVISILCIAFNHEKYIADAVAGFLVQKTRFPFEIIIHDDCSSDRTVEIVSDLHQRYPNIIRLVLQRENQYSRGIKPLFLCQKLARGRYIAPCEGDDLWLRTDKLQMQAQILEAHPEVFMCYHDVVRISERQLRVRPVLDTILPVPQDEIYEGRRVILLKNNLPRIATKMYRNLSDPPAWIFGKILAGDQVHSSIGGLLGKAWRIRNYFGAAWRINESSSWTPLSEDLRKIHIFSFRAWLAIYYAETGHQQYASHFFRMVANQLDSIQAIIEALPDARCDHYVRCAIDAITMLRDRRLA